MMVPDEVYFARNRRTEVVTRSIFVLQVFDLEDFFVFVPLHQKEDFEMNTLLITSMLIVFFAIMIGIGIYCRKHSTDVGGFGAR